MVEVGEASRACRWWARLIISGGGGGERGGSFFIHVSTIYFISTAVRQSSGTTNIAMGRQGKKDTYAVLRNPPTYMATTYLELE